MTQIRRRDESGSMVVELVILTPVLFAIALCMLVFGRVTSAQQMVAASSRAGAQAAAVMPTPQSAQLAAAANAVVGGFGTQHSCVQSSVQTNVSNFRPGGYVVVTVMCKVDLSDVTVSGMPGTVTISRSTTAPIDPYRSVQ